MGFYTIEINLVYVICVFFPYFLGLVFFCLFLIFFLSWLASLVVATIFFIPRVDVILGAFLFFLVLFSRLVVILSTLSVMVFFSKVILMSFLPFSIPFSFSFSCPWPLFLSLVRVCAFLGHLHSWDNFYFSVTLIFEVLFIFEIASYGNFCTAT